MAIKAPHVLRRERRTGVSAPKAPTKRLYRIVNAENRKQLQLKEFAGQRIIFQRGQHTVWLTDNQARFYKDHREIELCSPEMQRQLPPRSAPQRPRGMVQAPAPALRPRIAAGAPAPLARRTGTILRGPGSQGRR